MPEFLTNTAATTVCYCVIIACKIIYSIIINKTCRNLSKAHRNILTYLSFVLPIITGVICIIKCKNTTKSKIIVAVSMIIFLALSISAATIISYNTREKYYDANGEVQFYMSGASFLDADGNKYTFNFEKSGYDRLYINGTDEYLNSDLCYLDENGLLIYDDDMSISAFDESSCKDTDGKLYYPAKFSTFNEDGSVNYSFNSANFHYDRLQNAYTYNYVPYYDKDLNKYAYSFDSQLLKGFYTKLSTGEKFENEYCFVDENGYLVYLNNQELSEHKNENGSKTYTDSNGNTYFRASSVNWDKDGNMYNSHGDLLYNSNN